MHGDELRSVRERRFDLDFRNHFGNAVHHLLARDDMGAGLHQFGDRLAVPCALHDEIADERDRLGVVELDAAFQPATGHHGGHGDHELVLFARCQVHGMAVD